MENESRMGNLEYESWIWNLHVKPLESTGDDKIHVKSSTIQDIYVINSHSTCYERLEVKELPGRLGPTRKS